MMKKNVFIFLLLACYAAATLANPANTMATEAERQAQLGKAAATLFPGYASLCDLESQIQGVNSPQQRPASPRPAASETARSARPARTPIPPMQVFDNLFFLGNHTVTAWLYGTPAGYVLIDGLNTDQEAQTYILGGMQTLGLDPANIKFVLVTHAHGDHYGGADYIADTLGIDILMSAEDWELAAKTPDHPRFGPAPKQGKVVQDGEVLRFGQSAVTLHLTPGHTAGTLSLIFDVFDQGSLHRAMLWGGTGFNFGPKPELFAEYAASAVKMQQLSKAAGVDVFLSNHVRRDGANILMEKLKQRRPGQDHPFVFGEPGYALFDVLQHCALAQAARFSLQEGQGATKSAQ